MVVRQIHIDDALAFIGLNRQLSAETNFLLATPDESAMPVERQTALISSMHQQQLQMVFVAEREGRLVGFVGVTCLPLGKVKHIARFAIGVLNDVKRTGIGSQLIAAAEAWLKQKGVTRFEMTVIADNEAAISFYKKHGFEAEGVRKNAIYMNGRYYDEIYMAKLI